MSVFEEGRRAVSENIKKDKSKWKKLLLILAVCGVGIALLLFGGRGEKDGGEGAETSAELDAEAYSRSLEEKICGICQGVRGAGEVTVLVSLRGGYRTVYAFDAQSTSSGYKSEIVMSGSGSGKQAVVTAYENPEIAGIGIVCTGAEDPEVRRQIISLVSAALAVPTNKIFVATA